MSVAATWDRDAVGRAGPDLRRRGRRREDAVHRARDAVLVGAADDGWYPVEVEDRRRRGDLPLERHPAPRVGHGARAAEQYVTERGTTKKKKKKKKKKTTPPEMCATYC